MSHRLVIFGANGDLASRKLMPALARLHQVGKLPSGFSVLGITRNPWGTQRLRETLERCAGDVRPSVAERTSLFGGIPPFRSNRRRDTLSIERRPDPAYERLFPYYVELCAGSRFRSKLTGEGGIAGHAVMYIKDACKDGDASFPQPACRKVVRLLALAVLRPPLPCHIGRRIWKYRRTAKPAAAAARCLSVCPLKIWPIE
jgi:hypothetical protein